jgi:hypothetical protein
MLNGQCECGKIQYQIKGEVNDYSHCHCSQCRRLHGAAFASFAGVERSDFSYSKGESELSLYKSSASHQRLFCKHCGSNIMVALEDEAEALYIAMGTINGNPSLPKGYHIYVGSKAPWYEINDTLEQYDTEPES